MSRAKLFVRLAGFLLVLPGAALAIGVVSAAIGDLLLSLGVLSQSYSQMMAIISWLALVPLPFIPLFAAIGFGVILTSREAEPQSHPVLLRFWLVLAGLLAVTGPMMTGCLASVGGGEGAVILSALALLLFGTLSLLVTGIVVRRTQPLMRYNSLPLVSSALLLLTLVVFTAFFSSGAGRLLVPLLLGAFGLCWLLVGWRVIQRSLEATPASGPPLSVADDATEPGP